MPTHLQRALRRHAPPDKLAPIKTAHINTAHINTAHINTAPIKTASNTYRPAKWLSATAAWCLAGAILLGTLPLAAQEHLKQRSLGDPSPTANQTAPKPDQAAPKPDPAATNQPTRPDKRPNILWFIVDDMSANFSCYGEQAIRTPNVDRLATEGTKFTHAFVTAPVCSPCRSALITGMWHWPRQ